MSETQSAPPIVTAIEANKNLGIEQDILRFVFMEIASQAPEFTDPDVMGRTRQERDTLRRDLFLSYSSFDELRPYLKTVVDEISTLPDKPLMGVAWVDALCEATGIDSERFGAISREKLAQNDVDARLEFASVFQAKTGKELTDDVIREMAGEAEEMPLCKHIVAEIHANILQKNFNHDEAGCLVGLKEGSPFKDYFPVLTGSIKPGNEGDYNRLFEVRYGNGNNAGPNGTLASLIIKDNGETKIHDNVKKFLNEGTNVPQDIISARLNSEAPRAAQPSRPAEPRTAQPRPIDPSGPSEARQENEDPEHDPEDPEQEQEQTQQQIVTPFDSLIAYLSPRQPEPQQQQQRMPQRPPLFNRKSKEAKEEQERSAMLASMVFARENHAKFVALDDAIQQRVERLDKAMEQTLGQAQYNDLKNLQHRDPELYRVAMENASGFMEQHGFKQELDGIQDMMRQRNGHAEQFYGALDDMTKRKAFKKDGTVQNLMHGLSEDISNDIGRRAQAASSPAYKGKGDAVENNEDMMKKMQEGMKNLIASITRMFSNIGFKR